MSQSHNPKDSQALLQSMLQKLKLQPGRDGQALLETTTPARAAPTWGQVGGRGEANFQGTSTSPGNGFPFAAGSNPGYQTQLPSHCEVDGGLVSSPSNKGIAGEGTGQKGTFGPAILPVAGREQLLPVSSPTFKDSGNEDAVKSMGRNQDQNQGFSPKTSMSTGPQVNSPAGGEGIRIGNGDSERSKDVQFVASSPISTDGSIRRKQRSSENRTRRWTQKIKERWRDKHGNFGKKGKEDKGQLDQINEQVSPQNQPLPGGNMTMPPLKEEERTPPSLDPSDPSKTQRAHSEDSGVEGRVRSYSDFEFGLGSFSLLEEIATGQEWAKFLNPSLSVPRRPSEEVNQYNTPAHPHGSVPSPALSGQQGGASNPWGFWRPGATPGSAFGLVRTSPDASSAVNMEVLEEPMDDGAMQPVDRGLVQQYRLPTFVQLQKTDVLDRGRAPSNRKRQHQSTDWAQPDKEDHREGSMSAPSPSSSHEMGETSGSPDVIPLYALNSPKPASPSSFNPHAPVPRGVLKHSISQVSESSMETLSKRRRVEENRRVHFSEDIQAIEPQEVDLEADDSGDDSGADEDSVIEQECEVEPAPVEEVLQARRHALPAWILALKRKNTGRKNR